MPPPFGKEALKRVGRGRHQPCAVSSPASSLSPTPFLWLVKWLPRFLPGCPHSDASLAHVEAEEARPGSPTVCQILGRLVVVVGGCSWWPGVVLARQLARSHLGGGFGWPLGDSCCWRPFFQILISPGPCWPHFAAFQSPSTAPSGVWLGEIQSTPVTRLVFLSFLFCKIYFLALLGAGRVPGAYPKMRPGGDGFLRLAGWLAAFAGDPGDLISPPFLGGLTLAQMSESGRRRLSVPAREGQRDPGDPGGRGCVCVCMWGAGLVLWSGAPYPPRGQASAAQRLSRLAGGQWVELGPLASACLSACLYVSVSSH